MAKMVFECVWCNMLITPRQVENGGTICPKCDNNPFIGPPRDPPDLPNQLSEAPLP